MKRYKLKTKKLKWVWGLSDSSYPANAKPYGKNLFDVDFYATKSKNKNDWEEVC